MEVEVLDTWPVDIGVVLDEKKVAAAAEMVAVGADGGVVVEDDFVENEALESEGKGPEVCVGL